MSDGPAKPDLSPLHERYDIVGELRGSGHDGFTTYIGTRRDGGTDVVVTVATAAADDNNALSHLASDTKLLSGVRHPHLARVIDGVWLGDGAYAVVSERVRGTTLAERLDRGERVANPRIALLLQEVAAVLDWARAQGVVHRGVTPATIVVASDETDCFVSFVPTPIPLGGVPDACADARTIGLLTRDLLAGERLGDSTNAERGDGKSLATVRPDLAVRVLDETERMAACKQDGAAPDIPAFLATVASADVLKQAEVEMAALKEEYGEQHRAELKKCEDQRADMEQKSAEQTAVLAGEREDFEQAMAAERAKMEEERSRTEALLAQRQEHLSSVRAELERQREQLAGRLQELETKRVEFERLRAEAIAAGAAGAAIPAEPEPQNTNIKTKIAALPAAWSAARKERKERNARKEPEWQLPEIREPDPPKPPRRRPAWLVPAGLVLVLALLVVIAIGVERHNAPSSSSVATARASSGDSARLPRGGFLTQTAGGAVQQPFNGAPVARPGDTTRDTTSALSDSAQSAADSAAARALRHAAALAAARRAAQRDRERQAAEDSAARADTFIRRDSGGLPPIRPDSFMRRDSIARRDTLVRPDTIPSRPDTQPAQPARPDTTVSRSSR